MNLYGILGHYLPAFGRIVGQMQHDLFHVYTVDEHILMVIRNLRRFTEAQHAHEYPLCSRLIADFERKEVLYVAGAVPRHRERPRRRSFHARRARRAPLLPRARPAARGHRARRLARRAAPDDVVDRAEAGHLRSRRRRGVRRARSAPSAASIALYLLTVADIRGTSPKVWNAWKAQLLEDLFHATRARARRRRDATRTLQDSLVGAAGAKRSACCASTPCRRAPSTRCGGTSTPPYFQRHTAEEIAWHARHLYWRVDSAAAGRQGAAVARPAPGCRCSSTCPTRRSCSRASAASSAAAACRSSRRRSTRRGTATRSTRSRCTIPTQPERVVPRSDPDRRARAHARARRAGAARAARRRARVAAAASLPAVARGPHLPGRQGHALHPGGRRRRPARACSRGSPTCSRRRTSTS